MLSRLSALLCLVAVLSAAAATANPINLVSQQSPQVWLVKLSGIVDGSGVFRFSNEELTYEHKHWERPEQVQLNGHPWQDLGKSPEDWDARRRDLDLTHAWVIDREGRDTVAFERTNTGFSVFMNDSPNGLGYYSITIAIPLIQRVP